jgi:beta-lactamase class A
VTAAVVDLTTGRRFRYRRSLQLPTASTAKIDILMALLLRTPWNELSRRVRDDAEQMIRFSDNYAADRLYERIGMEDGLARANRKLGLKRTYAPAGTCVDLYCWGITQTTVGDQIRLIKQLVSDSSPLPEPERGQVLKLMERVTPGQRWGVSAAGCPGDQVMLKNGWLHHVANGRWAVVSVGLIRGHGHDYAVAVLTEDSLSMGSGIAKVQGVAKRVLAAFRGPAGCGEDVTAQE